MSELIFLHIDNINRGIENQSINFSSKFFISFNEGVLKIENKETLPLNFWSKKISNISLIAGKNGVGKTSLLDIIGFNSKTRTKNYPRARYFMIYHVSENLFYFEGTISDKIMNIRSYPYKKNSFFFKIKKNFIEISGDNHVNFIDIYYQRVLTNIPWATDKVIYKERNKHVNKFSDVKLMPQDVLEFIASTNILDKKNHTIKISQRKNYTNNPNQLFGLHRLSSDDIQDTYNFSNFYKSLLNENNSYKRSVQDNKYDKPEYRKEYFILRLLEKEFLHLMKLVTEKNYRKIKPLEFITLNNEYYEIDNINELQNQLIKSFINLRETSFKSLPENNELSVRISFLLETIKNLQTNLSSNFQINKDVDFDKLVEYLYLIPTQCFSSKNEIELDSKDAEFMQYSEFITSIFKFYKNHFTVKFKNFSDGEFVYLNVFSNVFKIIKNSSDKDLLLLLDEPDLNLHPEWSRTFIYKLIELIDMYKISGFVQIVITSHSPFVVTDFPKQNIYTVRIDKKGKTKIAASKFGFAANIYDVISDTFFMDYPIGEFAKSKISLKNEIQIKTENYEEIVNLIDDNFLKNSIKNQVQINLNSGDYNDKNS